MTNGHCLLTKFLQDDKALHLKLVAAGDFSHGFLFSAETGRQLKATQDDAVIEIDDTQFSSNGKYLFMNSGEGGTYLIRSDDLKVLQTGFGMHTFMPDGDHYLNMDGHIVKVDSMALRQPDL